MAFFNKTKLAGGYKQARDTSRSGKVIKVVHGAYRFDG